MKLRIYMLFLLAAILGPISIRAQSQGCLLTNVAEVVSAINRKDIGRKFEFVATALVSTGNNASLPLAVTESTGCLAFLSNQSWSNIKVSAGDSVCVRGYVDLSQFCPVGARLSSAKILDHSAPPTPQEVKGSAISDGSHDHQLVKLTGTVRDVFLDDIDPNFCVLVLDTTPGRVKVLFPSKGIDEPMVDNLVNADISVVGICLPMTTGSRRIGRHISAEGIKSIQVITASSGSLFDVQNLETLPTFSGEDISNLGRRRVFGKVIAAWGPHNFLINHAGKDIVRVELARGELPAYGDIIEAVGLPETDLYHINISRATWRQNRARDTSTDPPEYVTASQLLVDETGRSMIRTKYQGRPIRVTGTVRSVPSLQDKFRRLLLEDNGYNMPVDVSANPTLMSGISIGCKIEVAGICVLDTENWRPNTIVPRIKGVFIVPRIPSDITILSKPSWWTSGRLMSVVGVLLAILICILLWNSALRRRVEKRSRELTQETIARVTSDLKVGERTRLAMELHDSIVQNLTGVSMEIRTADRIADEDKSGMHQHLSLAVKILDSCRKDLRNCLWDLRNLTLEDEDVNQAIRKTLAPHIGKVNLSVRFNVSRELFCDNTTHTILRIIRELAINAIQHGKASSIKVAGCIENNKLSFSVQDNGNGFDPTNIPGMTQGHFGLQGIRDRLDPFDGDMTIQSTPGKGTKVSIFLSIPQDTELSYHA